MSYLRARSRVPRVSGAAGLGCRVRSMARAYMQLCVVCLGACVWGLEGDKAPPCAGALACVYMVCAVCLGAGVWGLEGPAVEAVGDVGQDRPVKQHRLLLHVPNL